MIVGMGLIARLSEIIPIGGYSRVVIVTDKVVAPLYLDRLAEGLNVPVTRIVLPGGEKAKNLAGISQIWTAMLGAACDRKTLVIALGGGVVGDMAGFAAATYMRGVDWVQVPTTALSQVDSGIGGKTGFDFGGVKNPIGVFSQPRAVIVDIETLETLSDRDFVADFAEIIKHGLIRDAAYLAMVTAKRPRDFSTSELTDIISGSVRIKVAFVQSDPNEAGVRSTLNYGHTVGHAVEALSLDTDAPLRHGEAVSIGMMAEAAIAVGRGLLSASDARKMRDLLLEAGLPVRVPAYDMDQLFAKMALDKKNAHGILRFTLLKGLGDAVWYQEVPKNEVLAAIRRNQEDEA